MKEKLSAFWAKICKALRPYKKNVIIPLLKIIGIIILCAVLVRVMNGHETLAEYAAKNPETAYHTVSSNEP
ncbi:MAG: hypothetical protein K6A74_07575 [Lachnospiraceae bacterium]|nr:hypothetical protein [Lachnospiraceae bacterium]